MSINRCHSCSRRKTHLVKHKPGKIVSVGNFEGPFLRSIFTSRPSVLGRSTFPKYPLAAQFPLPFKAKAGWREVGAQPTGHRCPSQGHGIGCGLSSRRSTCARKSIYHYTWRITVRERRFVTRQNNHMRLYRNRGRTDRNIASRPHWCYFLCVFTLHSKPGGLVSSFVLPHVPNTLSARPAATSIPFDNSLPLPTHPLSFITTPLVFTNPCVVLCIELPDTSTASFESFITRMPGVIITGCNSC